VAGTGSGVVEAGIVVVRVEQAPAATSNPISNFRTRQLLEFDGIP
jgi:hypothetical protein